MNFKKWVKSIQTAGYNGAGTVNKLLQKWQETKSVLLILYFSMKKHLEEFEFFLT
jgi:hypothetical protein